MIGKLAKTTLSRRSFFAAAPASAVALKQEVARVATAREASSYSVIATSGQMGFALDGTPHSKAYDEIHRMVRSGAMPEWKRRQMMAHARKRAAAIDDDLLCMQSLSSAARTRIQTEREFQRMITEARDDDMAERGFNSIKSKFMNAIGMGNG